ncbi:HD domain-containing protein [Mucilaginibacter sp. cycad4]|uniref:HD domain-containing protein n=1 Tax=Mucilaginibacter sp. cycad4 TaxID=3342096 RepID=UPI002AAA962C|nr:HD domain-containing protein [Mucilaginibacter gossypii]WPU99135.1 HD domain-containing protein [Mucilaginibacter gossypii]
MPINRFPTVAGIKVPDSKIANEATELLLSHGNEFIYNHSLRVFLFASLNGERNSLDYDPELLYVSAIFHDLGLTKTFSSPDLRFEVDGANAARNFLKSHGLPNDSLQLVWDAIALHTTIGVAEHKENEVALLYSGVGLDVMGDGYENLSNAQREEIITAFPRTDFKKKIIPQFFEGFEHKTETTFGNIKADVCAFMIPNFHRKNFCDCILHSPWSE